MGRTVARVIRAQFGCARVWVRRRRRVDPRRSGAQFEQLIQEAEANELRALNTCN